MKRLLCTLLALLTLCGCGQQNPAASVGNTSSVSSPDQSAEETYTPVTSVEEVKALYGEDAQYIDKITPYEGDFLVERDSAGLPRLDWVYGKSGIRRELLLLNEGVVSTEILYAGAVRVLTDGVNWYNGHQAFPHYETGEIGFRYDEYGEPRPFGDAYPPFSGWEAYWAPIGESHSFGMVGRREAVSSAQVEISGLAMAFGPLADGSDFVAAYCAPPETEITYDEASRTLTVTCRNTFLDSGEMNKETGVDEEYLQANGSLYPEDFPAGPLSGSCRLIESAEIAQNGDNAVVTVVLAPSDDPLQYTVETGYEGPADTVPYFRIKLRKAWRW